MMISATIEMPNGDFQTREYFVKDDNERCDREAKIRASVPHGATVSIRRSQG